MFFQNVKFTEINLFTEALIFKVLTCLLKKIAYPEIYVLPIKEGYIFLD